MNRPPTPGMEKNNMAHATRVLLPALLAALAIGGCAKQEAPKPPEKIVNIPTAPVARKNLSIVESAVGAETAVGSALDYDPTRAAAEAVTVRLPFPEHVARNLKVGQSVSLSSFTGGRRAEGRIRGILPALDSTTLSREVIVAVTTPGWRPDGSVRGEVTMGLRQNALVVPEQAVVLRPGGAVVYVVEGERARERRVSTGILRDGELEIVAGVKANETVTGAVDGAALLSAGAKGGGARPRGGTAP